VGRGRILRPIIELQIEQAAETAHEYLSRIAETVITSVTYAPAPMPVGEYHGPKYFHSFAGNRSRVQHKQKRYGRWSEE
jgi:hypothetical protein